MQHIQLVCEVTLILAVASGDCAVRRIDKIDLSGASSFGIGLGSAGGEGSIYISLTLPHESDSSSAYGNETSSSESLCFY